MTPAKRVYATTSFAVNGRTYASVDEMPADVRRHYEETLRMLTTDRDGNGVPDAFEAASDDPDVKHVVIGSASKRVFVDGIEIDQLEAAPPGLRDALAAVLPDAESRDRPARQRIKHEVALGNRVHMDHHAGIRMSLPALIAIIAVVAVVAGSAVWLALRS